MGKKIDGFVLSVLAACLLYLYFYRTIGNHTAAFLLAGFSFLLMRKAICRASAVLQNAGWIRKRRICRQMNSTLMQLACGESKQVEKCLYILLSKCYGGEYPVELVQMHPSSQITAERIFEIWKKHRGEDRLVLCATCACNAEARMVCRSLKQPQMAVLDANAISQLVAEHPEGIFVEETSIKRSRIQLKRIVPLLFNRKNAPRCLVFSLSMLLMYLLSTNIAYLAAAMFLLFVSLVSLRRVSRPAKLF